jgi:polyribonucleotide nucleotidyltransferase
LQIIRDLTASAEVGKTYLGKVSRLADFGAFVEILPGLDGCCTSAKSPSTELKMCATN